jgi:ribonuclease-3
MTDVMDERAALTELTQKLGVDIDPELLSLALTHRSWAYENGQVPHNERLEFLGDSVLGQAVTVRLFTGHPELEEGALAKRRASVVSTVALAEIARGIGLGAHLKLGRGEDLTGGRDKDSILADTTEAIIGAAYLSAGPDAATGLVLRLVEPLLADPERYGAAMGAGRTRRHPASGLFRLVDRPRPRPPVHSHRGGRRRHCAGRRDEQEAGRDGRGAARLAGSQRACLNSPRSKSSAPASPPR